MCPLEIALDGRRVWVVAPGDTLYSISLEIGTTVSELMEANPGVDPSNLIPGEVLELPEFLGLPVGPVPPCPSGFYWVVAPGDTLFLIASQVGTTVDELMALNPDVDPWNLRPGQSICLPFPPG
ncbi:MAG TPA: LysM peptidoglycan-binding domain-containing protein [Firmicutes bacterium]|nr:LysM peptidoglycan-binding domain-containing protein [Candidatus Fermentithermobacillaceae bacterium]